MPGLDQLDGDQPLDRLGLLGHPDRAHAALADLLHSLYGPMTPPAASRDGAPSAASWNGPVAAGFGRGLLEEAARACVEPQQVLHLLAQFRLPGAGLVQVGPALGRVVLCRAAMKMSRSVMGGTCCREAAVLQCGIRPRIAQTFSRIVRGLRLASAPPRERSSQARA